MNTLLSGLAAEARKAGSWPNFRNDFLSETKHGTYWHVTKDPRFVVDVERGPRDMSSMSADAGAAAGKLMVTSDLPFWAEFYSGTRGFAALVDMSAVPRTAYRQVKRGMGNEFWVDDPRKALVVKVMRISDALLLDEKFHNALPGSEEELHAFYDEAVSGSVSALPARSNPSWLKKKDEAYWNRAKEIVAEQRGYKSVSKLHADDWALVTHVFKGMHGQTSVVRGNPAFNADDITWEESPPPSKKTPVEEAASFLTSMKLGEVVQIGSSKWEVCEPRREGSVTVYFRKAGTKGGKFYTTLPNEKGELCVFLAGGSGQRVGPDVAVGHARIVKARNNPGGTAFDDAAEIMNFPVADHDMDARHAFVEFDPERALRHGGDTVLDRAWIRIAGLIGQKARASDEGGVREAAQVYAELPAGSWAEVDDHTGWWLLLNGNFTEMGISSGQGGAGRPRWHWWLRGPGGARPNRMESAPFGTRIEAEDAAYARAEPWPSRVANALSRSVPIAKPAPVVADSRKLTFHGTQAPATSAPATSGRRITVRTRNNPSIDDNSIAGLADRLQASFLRQRFAAKEVLAWRAGEMVMVAFRGDALSMELQLFSDDNVMMKNPRNSLDAEIQRVFGIEVKPSPSGWGLDSVLGQTMSDGEEHISNVITSVEKAASYFLDPAGMEEGEESVRVTLMPMEGTPWVKGSEKTRWYNAKTRKWTESGKPAGLTEVEVRGGSAEPETVMRTAMDFCTVVERIGATDAKYAAGRHGDQTFLVSHSMGFPAHGPGAEKIAEFWNRCGGILFPSVGVGAVPSSNFGPVAFILDPVVILAGMKPYHSRGRWPVVTYSSDAWTETTNRFFSEAAVELFQQMTGNWHVSIYGTPHFYILGPVVEEGSRAVKVSIINNTTKLASTLKARSKHWPREMSEENLEAMRGRADEAHYPYLESKVNGVLSLDCVHTVVAPKEMKKVLSGFLKSVGYKGVMKFIDVDDFAALESGDLKACYDYAWKVRDLILRDAPVMNVE